MKYLFSVIAVLIASACSVSENAHHNNSEPAVMVWEESVWDSGNWE